MRESRDHSEKVEWVKKLERSRERAREKVDRETIIVKKWREIGKRK